MIVPKSPALLVLAIGAIIVSVPARILATPSVDALIQAVTTHPDEDSVKACAVALSETDDPNDAANLTHELGTLLGADSTRAFVLATLAKVRLPQFDASLSDLLASGGQTPRPLLDQVLAAAANSGSWLTSENLRSNLWSDPSVPKDIRPVLLRTLMALQPYLGIQLAFLTYVSQPGIPDLENEPSASQLLRDILAGAAKNRDSSMLMTPSVSYFINSPFNGQLYTGAPGSHRREILTTIAQLYAGLDGPVAKIIDSLFGYAQDPTLQKIATNADYSELQKYPWLATFRLAPYLENPGTSPFWNPFKTIPFGLPRNNCAVEDNRLQLLSIYENGAKTAHLPVPTGNFLLTADKAKSLTLTYSQSLYEAVASSYGLPSAVVQPPNPPLIDFFPEEKYFSSINRAYMYASVAVSESVQKKGVPAQYAGGVSDLIVRDELESQALVAYSILVGRRLSKSQDVSLDLTDPHRQLDEILRTLPASFVNTQVVSQITVTPIEPLPDLSGTTIQLRVRERQLSFEQGFFREVLDVICSDGTTKTTAYVGPIPVSLINPLRRHPRMLDLLSVSLASRDIRGRVPGSLLRDDMDLVMASPQDSIPQVWCAIVDPALPWRHVRDSLLVEEYADLPSLVTTTWPVMAAMQNIQRWGPGPPWNQFCGICKVAVNDSDYAATTQGLLRGINDYANMKQAEMLADQIIQYQQNNLDAPCQFGDLACYVGLYHNQDPNAVAVLNSWQKFKAQAIANEQTDSIWDETSLRSQPVISMIPESYVFSSDLTRFASIYAVETASHDHRLVYLEGKLEGMPLSLQHMIRENPERF